MALSRPGRRTYPASRVKKRPIKWLWREHVPHGMIVVIAGRPELGKSLVTCRMAADVSHEYGVIVSTYEDPIAEVARPRLEAAGANLKNVHFWDKGIRMPSDAGFVRDEIERLGVQLLILDPASSHTRHSIYNATAIRDAFGPLMDIAEDTGCAIVFVHHIVKKVDLKADPLSAVGGSGGGLGALARIVYLFGESPDDPDERCMVQLKCNVSSRRPGLKLELDAEDIDEDISAGYLDVIGTHNYKAQAIFTAQPRYNLEKPEAVAEFLVENLREGRMEKSRLLLAANEKGFTKRMTRTVAEMLELRTVKHGTCWALHKEFPRALES